MSDIDFGTGPNTGDTLPVALAKLQTRIAVLEAGGTIITPAPAFTSAPSISDDGTPQVGEILTGSDGVITDGAVSARAWLLAGSAITGATGATYTPTQTGDHAYRVTATGPGGTTAATSAVRTVAAAIVTPTYDPPVVNLAALPRYLVSTDFGSAVAPRSAVAHSDGFLDYSTIITPRLAATGQFTGGEWSGQGQNFLTQLNAGGFAEIVWRDSPSGFNNAASTVTPPVVIGSVIHLRTVLNASPATVNGYAPGSCTFYTRTAATAPWVQFGAVVTGLATTGINTSNTPFTLGTLDPTNRLYGRTYSARLVNSAGAAVYDMDFSTVARGVRTSVTGSTGNVFALAADSMVSSEAPAYGSRFDRRNTTTKLKCVNIVHGPNRAWSALWGVDWSEARISSFLNTCVAEGANAVKINGNGISDKFAYPDDATFRSRLDFFFRQCRQLNLLVYWSLNADASAWVGAYSDPDGAGYTVVSDTDTTKREASLVILAKVCAWLAQLAPDLVVAIDVNNEWNYAHYARGWNDKSISNTMIQDMRSLCNIVRGSCDFPITSSTWIDHATALGDENDQGSKYLDFAFELDFDLADFHPYYEKPGQDFSSPPQASDIDNYTARQRQLPNVIQGENGVPTAYTTITDAQTKAWMDGLGAMLTKPVCRGSVFFCLTDYENPAIYQFGLYPGPDIVPAQRRAKLGDPFRLWTAMPNPNPVS